MARLAFRLTPAVLLAFLRPLVDGPMTTRQLQKANGLSPGQVRSRLIASQGHRWVVTRQKTSMQRHTLTEAGHIALTGAAQGRPIAPGGTLLERVGQLEREVRALKRLFEATLPGLGPSAGMSSPPHG